jgi:hypothetical protein
MDPRTRHLDYAVPSRHRPINWKQWLKVCACLIVLGYVALTIVSPDTHTTISICTKCGLYEKTCAHRLPFTSIPFRRSRTQNPTPLSIVLQRHQIRVGHQHQFVGAFSNSRTSLALGCGAGPGRHIDPLNSATVIDTLATYSDNATTEKWLDIILDPNRDHTLNILIFAMSPSPKNQSEFQVWWDQHQPELSKLSAR